MFVCCFATPACLVFIHVFIYSLRLLVMLSNYINCGVFRWKRGASKLCRATLPRTINFPIKHHIKSSSRLVFNSELIKINGVALLFIAVNKSSTKLH